jgi:membrane protein
VSESKVRTQPVAIVKEAAKCFIADDMPTYASALAFRFLLSLFPFLIFLTTLLGFLGVPKFFEWMSEQASQLLPQQAMETVNTVLDELQRPDGGLMSIAILIALWSASAAILSTMNALNEVFEVRERRSGWKRFLVAFGYTLALSALLVLSAAFMMLGPEVMSCLAGFVNLSETFVAIWNWIRWPIVLLLMMLVVSLVYYAAPNLQQPYRLITAGAVVAVIIWIVASLAFGYYVQNFGNYNKTYGSLGAVVVLLMYFFITAAVMLYGAEVNAALIRARGERIRESAG